MILATKSGWLISVEKVAESKNTVTIKERGETKPPYKVSKYDPDQKLFDSVDEARAWIDDHLKAVQNAEPHYENPL